MNMSEVLLITLLSLISFLKKNRSSKYRMISAGSSFVNFLNLFVKAATSSVAPGSSLGSSFFTGSAFLKTTEREELLFDTCDFVEPGYGLINFLLTPASCIFRELVLFD